MSSEITTPNFSRVNSQHQSIETNSANIFEYSNKKLHRKKTPDWNIENLKISQQKQNFTNKNEKQVEEIIEQPQDESDEIFDQVSKHDIDQYLSQTEMGKNIADIMQDEQIKKYQNAVQILEIQKYNSNQDQQIYDIFIELYDFYKENYLNKLKHDKNIFENTNTKNFFSYQIFINPQQNYFENQIQNQSSALFYQNQPLQKEFIKFGQQFFKMDKKQVDEKMKKIEQMIQSKDNINFELRKLFKLITSKIPQISMNNKDLVNLMKKYLLKNKKKLIKNSQSDCTDKKQIQDLKGKIQNFEQQEKIYLQDISTLKEMIQDMKDSFKMQTEQIQQLKQQQDNNQQEKNKVQKVEKQIQVDFQVEKDIVERLKFQAEKYLDKLSIIYFLKQNFSQIQLKDFKESFLTKLFYSQTQNSKQTESNEIYIQHLKKQYNVDMNVQQSQKINKFLKKSLTINCIQRLGMYQSSQNSQQCGLDTERINEENQIQQKQLLLQNKELEDNQNQINQKYQKLQQDYAQLQIKIEQYITQNNYLKGSNQKLRLQNLQMIKIKKKYSQQKEQIEFLQQKINKSIKKNWGTQTEKSQIIVSNDFDIFVYKKQLQEEQNTQRLQRQNSLTMFKKITIFHRKVEHYKQIIKELQYKLNDTRPLVSPRVNLDRIYY